MFSTCHMAGFVVLLVLLLIEPGISQLNDEGNTINAPFRSFCGPNSPITPSTFINNRNSTLAQLRSQILNNGVYYATARNLSDGDSVFGDAQCRLYLSTAQCVTCFDAGVSELVRCTTSNGAHAYSDMCFVRYENYADFYINPYADVVDITVPALGTCGNMSATQTTTFSEDVDGLLSNIRTATPRTSNFYVASTRKVSSENATVYAIAQCVQSTSVAICQECLNSAYNVLYNCLPNTEGTFIDMGCYARYSDTPFFNNNQTTDINNFLKGNSSKVPVISGAIAGAGLFFLALVLTSIYCVWKKSKKTKEDTPELKDAVNFNYKHLLFATNNFSEENLIGKGGFGEVFKAILDDNKVVAVKKLEVTYAEAKTEFENEVLLISHIRHKNLLRLLGWSSEVSNLLLVLEYVPNGSLDRFLWGAKRGTLNWKQRYDIILGIAKGLDHLHNELHVKIIHRDIKSSNVLLDDDFQPKIADFGLARFHPEDQSHVVTKFSGTLGYTAPEYALHGLLSDKVDTFSFGTVILEIVSGRRCTDANFDGPSTSHLLEHAWKLYENNQHINLVDKTMDKNQYEDEHVMKIIEIALLCTQSPVSKRPTMREVVLMLPNGQPLGQRELTRPTCIDHNRRVHIGSSKNSTGIANVSQKTKELDENEQLDVMEKGINIEKPW